MVVPANNTGRIVTIENFIETLFVAVAHETGKEISAYPARAKKKTRPDEAREETGLNTCGPHNTAETCSIADR